MAFGPPRTWLPVLGRGCGCCSLASCCMVQGCIMALLCALSLASGASDVYDGLVTCGRRCGSPIPSLGGDDDEHRLAVIHLVLTVTEILLFGLAFFTCVMFVKGASHRNPALMKPYVYLLYGLVGSFLLIGLCGLVPVPQVLLVAALLYYMLLCANSLRYEMLVALYNDQEAAVQIASAGLSPVNAKEAEAAFVQAPVTVDLPPTYALVQHAEEAPPPSYFVVQQGTSLALG